MGLSVGINYHFKGRWETIHIAQDMLLSWNEQDKRFNTNFNKNLFATHNTLGYFLSAKLKEKTEKNKLVSIYYGTLNNI